MPDQRDVPDKGKVTVDMHRMERIHDLMQIQKYNEKLWEHSPEDNQEAEHPSGQTVATNTTR